MVAGDTIPTSFGRLLRALRMDAGLTQEGLAERSGVSVDAISALESGRRQRPRSDTTVMLADGLGLSGAGRERLGAAARLQGPPREPLPAAPGPVPTAAVAATRTLPRDIAAFTGRRSELDRLLAAVSEDGRPGTVGVCAIDGMAGVGKTAFAVHAAHRLAARFPDGQLFVDLHAQTAGQRPVTAADALGALLLSTGVGAQVVPPDLDGRAALWRDRLAGRRMLILLDDAAGHGQVRPLLPSAPGCLVLVTSRRRLAALEDVEPLTLGTLPAAEAAELFNRLTGARAHDADPAAVAELVALCGSLPLAIGLVAGRLRSHPAWSVRYLADMLGDAQDRLAEMHAENVSLGAAFHLSYQDLAVDRQRLFRRLGLHPGREIDAPAAAALDGTDAVQAARGLDALHGDHLVDESVPGRYRLHDLVRTYARTLAGRDVAAGNAAAVDRLLDHYVRAAVTASGRIAQRSDPAAAVVHRPAGLPELSSRREALAWLDVERANLCACFERAVTHGRYGPAARLASALHPALRIAGHWQQALGIQRAALAAARAAGDRLDQAGALHDLADIQRTTGRYEAAAASAIAAMELYRGLGSQLGQANALTSLALVRHVTGEYRASADAAMEALAISRAIGDRHGQANALHALGGVQVHMDEYAAAAASLGEALGLFRELDHRHGEAETLNNLGALLLDVSGPEDALFSHRQALRLARELGTPFEEARGLEGIGRCLLHAGDTSEGAAHLRRALDIYRRLGAPDAGAVMAMLATQAEAQAQSR